MPKIHGQNLAQHRERTREQLFLALGELLKTRTFDSLTMAEIAQASGIGRTAVYNYFDHKESLLLAFIQYETSRYSAHLHARLQDIVDPLHKLRVYIREQLILGSSYHLAPSINLRQEVSAPTSRELSTHGHEIEDILSQILKDAMDAELIPKQNLLVQIALINGALAGRRLPDDPAAREYMIHALQTFILRGIGAAASQAPLPRPQQFFGRTIGITQNPFPSASSTALDIGACPVHQSA